MIRNFIGGLAKFFSITFHPIFIPLIGIAFIFNSKTYLNYTIHNELKNAIYLLIILNTILMPIVISSFLLWKGIINSIKMDNPKERIIPYIGTVVFYLLTIYLLKDVYVPAIVFLFMIGAAASVLTALIVNFFWKISAHMIGMGGLCGTLICISIKLQTDMLAFLLIAIIFSGLVGASRILLKAHNPSQIYIGFFVGVFWQAAIVL
jgi:membrane-associated phospholipid phosphatase